MTHSELRDEMRSQANVDSNRLPNAQATIFLNLAKDDIMDLHRLRFGEALITTAFVEDTRTINPAPSSGIVRYPTKLWYYDQTTGEKQEVREVSWEEYVDTWMNETDTGSGLPTEFAIYGEDNNGNPTFYLGPVPDADRSPVYLTARITFADLSADGDSNQLTVRAPMALVYRALIMAAPFLENAERIPEWDALYQPIVRRLGITHSGARYSGKAARQMQEPG